MEQNKKLSHCIERGEHSIETWSNKYTYTFQSTQYLESIDDFSGLSSYTYDEIRQMHIDALVKEFEFALNQVVFGDPAGLDYIKTSKLNKQAPDEAFNVMLRHIADSPVRFRRKIVALKKLLNALTKKN